MPKSHKPGTGRTAPKAVYDPGVFNVHDVESAKRIILTPEDDRSTDQRWAAETPHLIKLMRPLKLKEQSLVLDFGCGIGRLARELIKVHGCRVVGADISASMRALAAAYVESPRFLACHPELAEVAGPYDAALAVWVLQHVRELRAEIARIADALKPGGKLFVVNEARKAIRCVPTNLGWANDGVDLHGELAKRFTLQAKGAMSAMIVSEAVAKRTFWAIYRAS